MLLFLNLNEFSRVGNVHADNGGEVVYLGDGVDVGEGFVDVVHVDNSYTTINMNDITKFVRHRRLHHRDRLDRLDDLRRQNWSLF